MAVLQLPEAVVGGLLLFVVPGYALTRAVFPEWRLSGPGALRRAVEEATLSFVLSVVLTVLVGSFLLLSPTGFQAAWTDPQLEIALAGVAAVALAAAAVRGAFARAPPRPSPPSLRSEEGAWELTRELDRIGREERRLDRELSAGAPNGPRSTEIRERLSELRARDAELRRRREEEYAD